MKKRSYIEIKDNVLLSVDFGLGDDFAVVQKIRKNPDGSIEILSNKIIGRAKDYTDTEIEKYLNPKKNDNEDIILDSEEGRI